MKPVFRSSNLWRLAGLALLIASQTLQANQIHLGPVHGSDLSIAGMALVLYPVLLEFVRNRRGGPQ